MACAPLATVWHVNSVEQRIAENVRRVRDQIADSARVAGRDLSSIQLVAVTKYVGPAEAAALLEVGCEILGESRPQQLWEKAGDDRLRTARWHLVGHLQRNKIERTMPLVELIHSVDSERLLAALQSAAEKQERQVRLLLEVNCSGDAAKHGFNPGQLAPVVEGLQRYPRLEVKGLMTMAAREGGLEVARRNFADLRILRDQLQTSCPSNVDLRELSMGMSHDYGEAIAEGATIVRIGSALFSGLD